MSCAILPSHTGKTLSAEGASAEVFHPVMPFLPALLFPQPQHPALHLARRSHRQLVDKLDLAGIFVRREPPADVDLDVLLQALRGGKPEVSTMNALTTLPRSASGLGTTAAFATAGCFTRQFSISDGPMR
jgi:hypothetical protein